MSLFRNNALEAATLREKLGTAIIRTTYEVITPESAEEGDAEERGWDDEDGTEYTFSEALELLRGTEPSSSHYHPGIWYTRYDEQDYRTGETRNTSYHVDASPSFQRRLARALGLRGARSTKGVKIRPKLDGLAEAKFWIQWVIEATGLRGKELQRWAMLHPEEAQALRRAHNAGESAQVQRARLSSIHPGIPFSGDRRRL